MAREGLMDDTGYNFDICDYKCRKCKYDYVCEKDEEEIEVLYDKGYDFIRE